MRTNTIVTLGASAVFGIMAIVIARGWVNDAVSSQYQQSRAQTAVQIKPDVKTVPVLVADVDFNFGDQLSQQAVRLVDYPEDSVPLGSFSDFNLLFSDPSIPNVALTKIVASEPILDFKISGPGGRGTLSALIGENMRAVSIRVNDVAGVGGFIVPGDHVDVMLTRDLNPQAPGGEKVTSLLIQKLKVLGTDQNNNQQSSEPNVVKTVTLEVSNEDAQKLILAMTVGKLSLTLRRAGEIDPAQPLVVSVNDLNIYAKPKSVSRAKRRQPVAGTVAVAPNTKGSTASVTVVRDGKRDQVKVKTEPEKGAELAGGSL